MNYQDLDLFILKSIITNKKYAIDYCNQYNEKLFSPDLWRFAKIIIDYVRGFKNIPTKRVITERLKKSNNEALLKYVSDVWDIVEKTHYDDKEYNFDIEKLKERFSQKLIFNLRDKLSNDNNVLDYSKGLNEIKSIINHIDSINKPKAFEQNTLKGALTEFKNRYVAKANNPEMYKGIMTGYTFLDYTLNGIRESEAMLLAGATGSGKSLGLLNLGINMYMGTNEVGMTQNFRSDGNDVLYFSLEMPFMDCMERVLSRMAMVPQKKIRDAALDEEEKERLSKAMKFIDNYDKMFEIVDVPRGATIQTIEMIFHDVCIRRRKPKVVIVDYLGLMELEQKMDEDWLSLAKISEQLHEFARTNSVVLITAAQLNEQKQGKDANPIGLNRIGRSRQVAHNFNFVIQIEQRPNEATLPNTVWHLIKSRRTELTYGILDRNAPCAAILDKPILTEKDPGDISGDINK